MIELVVDSAAPRHWDYVLTCFEPITRVTGGIGTYTRLLLEQLHELKVDDRPINILFFTGERQRSEEFSKFCPRAAVVFVPEQVRLGSSPLNNLGDPYRHFGVGIMRSMRLLERLGHSFGYVETPDYSAEGYYLIKARRFGLLKLGRTGVRLHSPLFMLHEDNDSIPWCDSSAFRFHDMERYCIQHADDVLFGGDAMRDRVFSLLPPDEAEDARRRAVKIPHPWPQEGDHPRSFRGLRRTQRFAYVGRLEFRKGVDLLVEAALEALDDVDFELHFYGRDTNTWRQASLREQLDRLVKEHPRASRFVFHDYVPQDQLWRDHLPTMDGFIFPSRFENYPNVLLEVLQFGKPTLVSQFGCMPEMGAEFPNVVSVDPFNKPVFAEQIVEAVKHGVPKKAKKTSYGAVQGRMNGTLRKGYLGRLQQPSTRVKTKASQPSLTFVIAHYNQSKFIGELLDSLKSELIPGDDVIVVDDCSKPAEAKAARGVVTSRGFTFLSTERNSGPSKARNVGIAKVTTDCVYIVDADDLIEAGTTAVLRQALAADKSLEVVSGFFQAFEDEHHAWAAYDPIPETILIENTTHCGILARKEVFTRLGGYSDEQREHFEDWEFAMRLALTGVRVEVAPIVTYRYRVQKKTSRNNTRLERAGYSYEHALQRALSRQPSAVDWKRLARVVPGLIVRREQAGSQASRDPSLPREVRYEVADRINLLVKPTPLHLPIKQLVAWGLRQF